MNGFQGASDILDRRKDDPWRTDLRQGDIPAALSRELAGLSLPERIARARSAVAGSIVFTTSLGLEDQALTHAIVESGADVAFATLDTGRLFGETLALWAETERHFGIRIRSFAPDRDAAEGLIERDGPFGFRHSEEARRNCCGVRKVGPLGRALAGAGAWLTGLRGDQSSYRTATPLAEFDAVQGLPKFNLLADWDRDQVARYVADHGVPYNPLHDQGFLSIGCAPCTRAVRVGEPERAGRWWWEADAKKECGLHDRHPAVSASREPAAA